MYIHYIHTQKEFEKWRIFKASVYRDRRQTPTRIVETVCDY